MKLIEKLRGEPIGRVVFAEVVPQFLRHKVLVKLFQQVARAVGIGVQGDERIVRQLLNHVPKGFVNFRRPVFDIPTKEIAFEKVANAEMTEDAAFLHRAKVVLQPG